MTTSPAKENKRAAASDSESEPKDNIIGKNVKVAADEELVPKEKKSLKERLLVLIETVSSSEASESVDELCSLLREYWTSRTWEEAELGIQHKEYPSLYTSHRPNDQENIDDVWRALRTKILHRYRPMINDAVGKVYAETLFAQHVNTYMQRNEKVWAGTWSMGSYSSGMELALSGLPHVADTSKTFMTGCGKLENTEFTQTTSGLATYGDDSGYVSEDGVLAIVSDGVGINYTAKLNSRQFCNLVRCYWELKGKPVWTLQELKAVMYAVDSYAEALFHWASCTFTVAIVDRAQSKVLVAHLGDCQAVLTCGGSIIYGTEDMWRGTNCPYQLMAEERTLSIFRFYEWPFDAKRPHARLLLYSDGVTDNLHQGTIESTLRKCIANRTPQCSAMGREVSMAARKVACNGINGYIAAFNSKVRGREINGKPDDITVIVVDLN